MTNTEEGSRKRRKRRIEKERGEDYRKGRERRAAGKGKWKGERPCKSTGFTRWQTEGNEALPLTSKPDSSS